MAKDPDKLCLACPATYPAAYSTCPRCQLPLVFPVIGKVWYVDGLIGRGGMGAVFMAHHVEDRRKRAAVKVLVPIAGEMKADRVDRLTRFQREAVAMKRLTHDGIVQFFDFARERDGSLYLAMEYLEGPNLKSILKDKGMLPPADAIEIIKPVLSALAAAHKAGVIHRDIKPDNVILAKCTESKKSVSQVKVLDFGVARLTDDQSVTDTGQALGTPVYMSPEQAQGGDIDARVDIYGAGVVLYEMLAGQPPFVPPEGPNANLIVLAHSMTTDPEPPSVRQAAVSKALDSVVLRAIYRDREQRFRSCDEFLAALEQAVARPDEPQWSPPAEPKQLQLPAAVAAAMQRPGSRPPSAPSTLSLSGQNFAPVPRSQTSLPSGPTRAVGPAPSLISSRSAAGIASVASRSSAGNAPPQLGRSSATVPPVGGERTVKPASSLGYKLLVASVYLALVSVILIAVLLDKSGCK